MRITDGTGTAEPAGIRLFDPDLYADGDPHLLWRVLREQDPVHHESLDDGRQFWSVTRYQDVCDVLRDHSRFTSERGTLLCALDVGDPAGGVMMAATDPPRHTAMREPLMRAMSPAAMQRQQHRLGFAVRRLLGGLLEAPVWDLAGQALAFPMAFTGTLMGLPEKDWPRLTKLTTMSIAPDDAEFQEGSSRTTLVVAHHELFDYFADQLAQRRGVPSDDLFGELMRIRPDGQPMSQEEIVYNCYSLLLGANVTTPHAISATVAAFAERPDSWRQLRQDPALLSSAIEEGLRWSSPANHFMRYAKAETEIGGKRLPAGAAVAAWLGSANRDAAQFEDPFRFDIRRRGNRHVAFGFGPHYCVGAALARLTMRMLFAELVTLVESFEVVGEVRHLRSNFVAGISHLPLAVRLASDAAGRIELAMAGEPAGVA